MNAKLLKWLRIVLAIVGITFLLFSMYVRYTDIQFLSAFNQWLFNNFGVINFASVYLSIALVFGILRSLVEQIEVYLQNKVNQ